MNWAAGSVGPVLGIECSTSAHFIFIMKMTVFWDIKSRSLVEINGRFRGDYCLHRQGNEWVEK
jgi:hypothetical protein